MGVIFQIGRSPRGRRRPPGGRAGFARLGEADGTERLVVGQDASHVSGWPAVKDDERKMHYLGPLSRYLFYSNTPQLAAGMSI